MQNAATHTETNKWTNPRLGLPTSKSKLIGVLSVLIGFGIVAAFVLAWTMAPASSLNPALNNPPVSSGDALSVSASRRSDPGITFEQNARDLANSNTPEANQMLLQTLKQSEPASRRSFVLSLLKNVSPAAVPGLMTALSDSDSGVRAGAAQVLGMRREREAIAALSAATRDPDATVRREAVVALGSLGAWEVLPRLEQLQVNEPNYAVRQAASAAKESFKREIAQAIGVPTTALRDISVSTGNLVQIYAATSSHLYALYGNTWTRISPVPDLPIAIATGSDPAFLYLATVSSGLYRSFNGGETWEHVQFGLQTPTQLSVTAIVIDPQNSHHVYIALVSEGAETVPQNPLGISESRDGGTTWWAMENAPTDVVITQLVLDPQEGSYLFGMTSDTPWRYALP